MKHYKIEFEYEEPEQLLSPKEINCTPQEQEDIDKEIDKLLIKGVISETTHCSGEYISTIFIRPQKDGGHRLILDLKDLIEHVEYHHFKIDTLQSAIRLLTPNCGDCEEQLPSTNCRPTVHRQATDMLPTDSWPTLKCLPFRNNSFL